MDYPFDNLRRAFWKAAVPKLLRNDFKAALFDFLWLHKKIPVFRHNAFPSSKI